MASTVALLPSIVQGLLDAGIGLQEAFPDQIRGHLGHQEDSCVFQHHGDGGSLVAAQLKVGLHPVNEIVGALGFLNPPLEAFFAQALLAGANQNDDASGANGVLGVVQGLLGLV